MRTLCCSGERRHQTQTIAEGHKKAPCRTLFLEFRNGPEKSCMAAINFIICYRASPILGTKAFLEPTTPILVFNRVSILSKGPTSPRLVRKIWIEAPGGL